MQIKEKAELLQKTLSKYETALKKSKDTQKRVLLETKERIKAEELAKKEKKARELADKNSEVAFEARQKAEDLLA